MNSIRLFLKNYAAHLAVLILGSCVMLGGCFHDNLWFDEAYTVGMMRLDLPDLLFYSSFDVHPQLYYLMLKCVVSVFGDSLAVMRLFSVLGMVLFASLGLTHLRRDFGKKVGFWFSFCTVFSGAVFTYALQIRMYSWVMYFVGLAAIYCYRMHVHGTKKNRVMFLVFSICAAYTHYFGLFASAAMNLLLLYHTLREKRPMQEWRKNAVIQLCSYIPGGIVFAIQILMGGATWIKIFWPDLIFDFVSCHLLGDVPHAFAEHETIGYVVLGGVAFAMYAAGGILLYWFYKKGGLSEHTRTALKASVYVYFGIILFALTMSLFRPLYHVRYTVVISFFFLFAAAVLLASFKKRLLKILAAAVILLFFAGQGLHHYRIFYHESSTALQETVDSRMQEGDCILFDDTTLKGYVVAVQYPENQAYFFNYQEWTVVHAYQCFGPNTHVLDKLGRKEIDSLPSRVWLVEKDRCYDRLLQAGYREAEHHQVTIAYHDSTYTMYLMVKDETPD